MTTSPPRRTPDHLRVDPDRLPDPRLFARGSAYSGPVRRIALFGVLAVAGLSLTAFAVRSALARGRSAATAGALARLPALAAEGVLGTAELEPPRERVATPAERAALERSWIGSETIAPRDASLDRATGEEVLPFQGFGVDVETAPAGARVWVNGAEVGTSPILATVHCEAGAEVEVRAERGAARGRARTRCRDDALVKVRVALRP